MQQMVTCLLTDPDASGSACAKDCTSMVCSCCSLRPWAVVASAAVADDDACSHACSQSSMHCSVRWDTLQHKRHGLLRAVAMAVADTQAQVSFVLEAPPECIFCACGLARRTGSAQAATQPRPAVCEGGAPCSDSKTDLRHVWYAAPVVNLPSLILRTNCQHQQRLPATRPWQWHAQAIAMQSMCM